MINNCEVERYGNLTFKQNPGNLFNNDSSHILVHCVSSDFAMGAGIAKDMCVMFPDLRTAVSRERGWNGHGRANIIYDIKKDHPLLGHSYTIVNLVTKEKYYNKPTYTTIREALENMKIQLKLKYPNLNDYSNLKIAMPRIGCGLDKLKWDKVSEIIKDVFKYEPIIIIVNF